MGWLACAVCTAHACSYVCIFVCWLQLWTLNVISWLVERACRSLLHTLVSPEKLLGTTGLLYWPFWRFYEEQEPPFFASPTIRLRYLKSVLRLDDKSRSGTPLRRNLSGTKSSFLFAQIKFSKLQISRKFFFTNKLDWLRPDAISFFNCKWQKMYNDMEIITICKVIEKEEVA